MSTFKKFAYLLIVNLAVLVCLLCVVNIASLVFLASSSVALDSKVLQTSHPNWDDDTAEVLASTSNFRNYKFQSYIGWRHSEYSSAVLNVDKNGIRRSQALSEGERLGIFGGSTVWGYGVSDGNTISSLVAEASNGALSAVNYGEQAYVSGQSLSYLIQLLKSGEFKEISAVAFYDGVNDVVHGCNTAIGPKQHYQYPRINQMIKIVRSSSSFDNKSAGDALAHYFYELLFKYSFKLFGSHGVGEGISSNIVDPTNATLACSKDSRLANAVAENLVKNWQIAHELLRQRNVRFRAILQPTLYLKHQDKNIQLNGDWLSQFEAVYPLVIKKAKKFHWFVDLHRILEQQTGVYIDSCCHLNRRGNLAIASALSNRSFWE